MNDLHILHTLLHILNADQLSTIAIEGTDATTFLQGQLTCDVEKLTPEKFSLGAHCNLKGRVVSLFWITRDTENYYLTLPESIVETTIKSLQKYVLRSKVSMTVLERHPRADGGPDAQSALQALPAWIPAFAGMTERNAGMTRNFLTTCIEQHIPFLSPKTVGMFLPADLELDKHGAISLNKGCFIGQEIIARMHYLGKSKNELCQFSTTSKINAGDAIIVEDKTMGHVICTAETPEGLIGLACMKKNLDYDSSAFSRVPISFNRSSK